MYDSLHRSSVGFLAHKQIRAVFSGVALIVGFLHAWANRFEISPDGVAYLDIASAYLRHDWSSAVNAYWSPLYSWVLAGFLFVFRPNVYWEIILVHVVGYLIFLFAFLCFDSLLNQFVEWRTIAGVGQDSSGLPSWVFVTIGYSLFLSSSFFLIGMSVTTPDMLVGALVFLAFRILLRIHSGKATRRDFAFLGVVLGVGYLAKAYMFPLGFVFLLCAFFHQNKLRRGLPGLMLACVAFLVISSPFILVLSKSKQRLTYGDVGKIAFAEAIDSVPSPPFWRGENGTGTPRHPAQLILQSPQIYRLDEHIRASDPAVDMSYWMEGLSPYFRFKGEVAALRQSFGTLYLILQVQIEVVFSFLVLWFLSRSDASIFPFFGGRWQLWLPPTTGVIAFSMILLEPRYIAPFVAILWLIVFATIRIPKLTESTGFVTCVLMAMLVIFGMRIAKTTSSTLLAAPPLTGRVAWEVSQGLHELGVNPGSDVAIVSVTANGYWARLAGVCIRVRFGQGQDQKFWDASLQAKQRILEAIRSTGNVTAVVTQGLPSSVESADWRRVRNTDFFVLLFPGNESN